MRKRHKRLKVFAILNIIISIILVAFLVMGAFKLEMVESIVLDFWNELALGIPELSLKNSMGSNAWLIFYCVFGALSAVFITISVCLSILAFKKDSHKTVSHAVTTTTTITTTTKSSKSKTANKEAKMKKLEEIKAERAATKAAKLEAKLIKKNEKLAAKEKKLEAAVKTAEETEKQVEEVKKSATKTASSVKSILDSYKF